MSLAEWNQRKRLFKLLAVVAVAAAVIGLIVEIRRPSPALRSADEAPQLAQRSLNYTQLREGRRGQNHEIYSGAFERLASAGPGILDPVEQTAEEREHALQRRRQRRAFAGAPPTIPHSVQEKEPAACLLCHEKGAKIAGLTAPAMSHKYLAMCTQCHAMNKEENAFTQAMAGMTTEDDFEGLHEPRLGERAYEGAPPTIPHPTFMREACSSCHGIKGKLGMRATHPVRQNCEQCHAPAAEHDPGAPPRLPD